LSLPFGPTAAPFALRTAGSLDTAWVGACLLEGKAEPLWNEHGGRYRFVAFGGWLHRYQLDRLRLIFQDAVAPFVATLKTGEHPIPAFHWPVEFPEVGLEAWH
jgi:hypothetical protein